MSAFRFLQPTLPRRIVWIVGYGLIALVALIGLVLIAGADGRNNQIADLQDVIARAETLSGTNGAGLPPTAFHVGDTPQLAQAVLQTNLQSLADRHRILIDVIRADQIDQIDGFVRLNLTLSGVAPETELGSFLHGLSALEPIVVLKEIALRRARDNRRDGPRQISFEMELYGLSQR